MTIKDLFQGYTSYQLNEIIGELKELIAENDKKTKLQIKHNVAHIKPGQSGASFVKSPKLLTDKVNKSYQKKLNTELELINAQIKITELELELSKLQQK